MEDALIPLAILVGLFFFLVVPILAIRANLKLGTLEREIAQLRKALAAPRPAPTAAPVEAPKPIEAPKPVEAPEPVVPQPVAEAAPVPPPLEPKKPKPGFEEKLGGRIFVYIGAVMLALAGAFLVKYSIDVGLLSPGVRIVLGLLMGVALLGGGQWLRKDSPVIAQALAAAAVADWFASLFAAVSLYHLLSPVVGFVALAIVTAIGIALSLREGILVGLVGIAGGFITPAIVSTGTPQPGVLFVYLYLIQLGALILQHKRGWWQLAALGIGGGLLWAMILAVWEPTAVGARLAALWLPLFLLATDVTQLWSLYGKGGVAVSREMTVTARAASIACFLLMAFWLTTGSYRLDDWVFLMALTLLHLAAARRFASEEIPALVGAAIAIGAYAAWSPFGYDWSAGTSIDRSTDLILVGLVLGAAFGGGGFWFELGATRPARWAGLSTLGTAFLFGGAYLNLNEADLLLTWPIQAVILAALHMAAAERLNRLRHGDAKYAGALGLHGLAVSGFLALAVPMRFEHEWIAVSWAIELPVMAWVALKLDLPWLKRGIWVGAALIVAAVLLSGFPTGDWVIFNRLLYGIGIPCAGLIGTAAILKRTREIDRETRRLVAVLELAGAALLALLIGFEVSHAVGRLVSDSGVDFLRCGIATIAWAGLALALYHRHARSRFPDPAYLTAAIGFTVLACGALVAGGFVVVNPLFSPIAVGETWIFNRLLIVYAAPAALLLLIADRLRRAEIPVKIADTAARGVGLLALVTGFVWASLAVRQMAHGTLLDSGAVTDGEQYGYSAAWTLYGLMLLALGTWMRSQLLRYASAMVVLITVSKVFLIDAANLTGLYRVASFLGLGLSLIGIGYLYQRLLFRRRD